MSFKGNFHSKDIFNSIIYQYFDDFIQFVNDPAFDPNIHSRFDGETALMMAVGLNIEDSMKYITELLKNKKLDINLKDINGLTAIQLTNDPEVIFLLYENGAQIKDEREFEHTIRMIIYKLECQIDKYKNIHLNELEIEYLNGIYEIAENRNIESTDSTSYITKLEKCLTMAKEMVYAKPGGKKHTELKKTYKNIMLGSPTD